MVLIGTSDDLVFSVTDVEASSDDLSDKLDKLTVNRTESENPGSDETESKIEVNSEESVKPNTVAEEADNK